VRLRLDTDRLLRRRAATLRGIDLRPLREEALDRVFLLLLLLETNRPVLGFRLADDDLLLVRRRETIFFFFFFVFLLLRQYFLF
jgi:hypothetical protein